MLIMLVENNVNEMERLKSCVSQCYPDSDVVPFTESTDALEFIKSDKLSVDMCFTAVIMPKVTGFGLVTELKKHNKTAKIVFVSDTPDYAIDAWQHFANDYLLTPITYESIKHTLSSCFSVYESNI